VEQKKTGELLVERGTLFLGLVFSVCRVEVGIGRLLLVEKTEKNSRFHIISEEKKRKSNEGRNFGWGVQKLR